MVVSEVCAWGTEQAVRRGARSVASPRPSASSKRCPIFFVRRTRAPIRPGALVAAKMVGTWFVLGYFNAITLLCLRCRFLTVVYISIVEPEVGDVASAWSWSGSVLKAAAEIAARVMARARYWPTSDYIWVYITFKFNHIVHLLCSALCTLPMGNVLTVAPSPEGTGSKP